MAGDAITQGNQPQTQTKGKAGRLWRQLKECFIQFPGGGLRTLAMLCFFFFLLFFTELSGVLALLPLPLPRRTLRGVLGVAGEPTARDDAPTRELGGGAGVSGGTSNSSRLDCT